MTYGIPDLDLRRFPAAQARVDRLDIKVYLGVIRGTELEIRNFVHAVPRLVHDGEGNPCSVLNSPRQPRNRWKWGWTIPKRVVAGTRRPLFGGKLMLERSSEDRPNASVPGWEWYVILRLYLNPTRWLRYQPVIRDEHGEHSLSPDTVDLFTRDLEPCLEHVLVPEADNVIVGTPERIDMAGQDLWPRQLRRYLHAVFDLFQNSILRPAEQNQLRAVHAEDFRITLNSVEVYWEQGHDNPVELLHEWEPRTRRWAAFSNTNYRSTARIANSPAPRINDLMLGRWGASPAFTMPLHRGATFKVYAKTDRRIRFEIL